MPLEWAGLRREVRRGQPHVSPQLNIQMLYLLWRLYRSRIVRHEVGERIGHLLETRRQNVFDVWCVCSTGHLKCVFPAMALRRPVQTARSENRYLLCDGGGGKVESFDPLLLRAKRRLIRVLSEALSKASLNSSYVTHNPMDFR